MCTVVFSTNFTNPSSRTHTYNHNTHIQTHKNKKALYFETAAVLITVVLFGKYLECYARGVTASAINTLMKLRARTTRLVQPATGSCFDKNIVSMTTNGDHSDASDADSPTDKDEDEGDTANDNPSVATTEEEEEEEEQGEKGGDTVMDVSLLQKGDIVRLVLGEHVPCDCILVSGAVGLDESMLTGESALVGKREVC